MLELLGKIKRRIKREISSLPEIIKCVYFKCFHPEDVLIMRAGIKRKKGVVSRFNWGDDLNYFFFQELTGKKICFYPDSYISRIIGLENYECIGSIISFYSLSNSLIWGSGLINDVVHKKIIGRPKKVLAVRGPLTREWLQNQGVDCPEVYGDPALLLPLFYRPIKKKNYKIGLIPHYIDENTSGVKKLLKEDGVKLISMHDYGNWKDILDEINSCEMIVSSSLHGLIVAEAYGIPSIWAEFNDYVKGWEFKYHDFFASIGKGDTTFVKIDEDVEIKALIVECSKWREGRIDLQPLIDACPFELNIK